MAAEEAHIYRDLMRFKPTDLTPNGWAVKAGVSRTVWADMRRHGNPSRRTLEKLLVAVSSSLAEFEALRLGDQPVTHSGPSGIVGDPQASPWSPAQLPPLPLIAATLIGGFGDSGSDIALVEIGPARIIEQLPRPLSLAGDPEAYAITIVAPSMLPRFRLGRRIAVSPRSSVAVGDDVLISLRASAKMPDADTPAVIGELVARANDSIELRQFQPERPFSIGNAEIRAVHRIVGELI